MPLLRKWTFFTRTIMNNSYLLLLLSVTFFCQSLFAQLTPQVAISEMGRGINLGNTLEPPTEGAWNNGPAQESYFDAYVSAGFTNVRVPVRWDLHTGQSAPFAIDSTWMNRVEEVVDWGLSRGLYITLNGHHEDWLKNNYNNPVFRARYDSIWVQVAAYKYDIQISICVTLVQAEDITIFQSYCTDSGVEVTIGVGLPP
ncbi:MAG: cellulase family glycosylhydrolase, partial [Bacteroidota bacterium]